MKYRNGFVSNSSSSSFIVIDTSGGYNSLDEEFYTVGEKGEIHFGWGPEVVRDIDSRINFCYLQADIFDRNLFKKIEYVIKENSNIKKVIIGSKLFDGYIDHQSSASEGQNIEMFKNVNTLKDFIFGSRSKIVVDNDNH